MTDPLGTAELAGYREAIEETFWDRCIIMRMELAVDDAGAVERVLVDDAEETACRFMPARASERIQWFQGQPVLVGRLSLPLDTSISPNDHVRIVSRHAVAIEPPIVAEVQGAPMLMFERLVAELKEVGD